MGKLRQNWIWNAEFWLLEQSAFLVCSRSLEMSNESVPWGLRVDLGKIV
jgi:hypothetical protein